MTPTETAVTQSDRKFTAFIGERSAAVQLGVSVETLRTWRRQKRGPRYRKIGGRCVRYSIDDLAAFIDAQPAGGGQAAI